MPVGSGVSQLVGLAFNVQVEEDVKMVSPLILLCS